MRLATPALRDTPPWPTASTTGWDYLTRTAARAARTAGAGRGFPDRVAEVRALLQRGKTEVVRRRLASPQVARALVHVWRDDAELAARTMRADLVREIAAAWRDRPSRLTLLALASLHLTHFDTVEQWEAGLFDELAITVLDGVTELPAPPTGPGAADLLAAFRLRADVVTELTGPAHAAAEMRRVDTTLARWLADHGLVGSDGGRFGQLLRQAVHLERLRAADPSRPEELGFLEELTPESLVLAPGTDGLQFGHAVLRAMTDRPGANPSEPWVATILAIAGDPRLTHTTPWAHWWRPLPPEHAATMRRWLSIEDLKLFLDAVETFGRTAERLDLQRMFPARKRFLLGLYESGIVVETRLIMGDGARSSVLHQLGRVRSDISRYASERNTAVIVVDCGAFFLVEGSHNFQLYLYAGRPLTELVDRRTRVFDAPLLKEDLPDRHTRSHPYGLGAVESVRHLGLWQGRALEYLMTDLGQNLDPRLLLDAPTYQDLARRGMPVVGSRRLM